MADEWSEGINWFQYMTTSSCDSKNFFFSKSSYDQYSATKSFEESLDERIAEFAKYKSTDASEQTDTTSFPGEASHDAHQQKTQRCIPAESAPQDAPPEKKGVPPQEKKGVSKEQEHEDVSWKHHRLDISRRADLDNPGSKQMRPLPSTRLDKNVILETPFKYSYLAPLKNPRIPYPRESSLTHEEHKKYLELFTRFMSYIPSNPTQAEIKDILIYKELQMKVGVEQEEFMKYLEVTADKCIEDYLQIHPDARKFSEALLTTRLKRSANYPRHYFPSETIQLELKKPFDASNAPVLSCKATLLELGPIPKVVLPTITYQTKPKACFEFDKLCNRYPPTECSEGKTKSWSKEDLSSDVNAEKLAIQYGADVVLSAGGVTCIMNNHGPAYEREWEIPVIIKEYIVDENGKKVPRKVVFVDKPLLPKTVCARDLNTLYHKYTLKATLIHQQSKLPAKFRTKGKDAGKCKDTPDTPDDYEAVESYAIEDLETFGTDKVNITGSWKETNIPVKAAKKDQVDLKNLQKTLFGGSSEIEVEKAEGCGSGGNSSEEGAMEHGPSITSHARVDQVVTRQGGVTTAGTHQDSPQSPDFDSPQSPDSKDNDTPQSPDSREIESPMSPVSHTVADVDRASPMSPSSADAPMSPVASASRDLFLSAPKIIPVERIESETDETLRGRVESHEESSGAHEGDASLGIAGQSQTMVQDDNEETDVSFTEGRKRPVRRSLRGRNIGELCEDVGDDESRAKRGRGRRSTRSTHTKPAIKTSETRVADTDSDDNVGLVIDVESEDSASPPRRQTRQRGGSHPRAVLEESQTLPRITRSSAVDMKSPTAGSRSLGGRKHGNDACADDEADVTVTSPVAQGRVTRRKQSPVATSEMESGLHSSDRMIQSGADEVKDIPTKRSMRSTDQDLPPPEPLELPQPRKRGRPKKLKHIEETPTKQSDDAMDVQLEADIKTSAEIVSSGETKVPGMPPVAMVKDCDSVAIEMDNNTVGEKSADVPVVESSVENKPESLATLESKTKGREKAKVKKEVKSGHSSTTLDAILNLQQQMLRPGEKMKKDDQQKDQPAPQQSRPCSQDNNATYRLWSLADLNLIIRTSEHGFLRDPSSLKTKPVYLFPKMEYQPMFGVEQVTVCEQAKMWTSAFLRLNCNIIRARICAFTSEIMMLEDLEPSKILPPRGMFEPGVAMQRLHTVLDKVVSLPPGVHILKHTPGESQCQILQHILSKKSGSYDLHQSYIIGDLHDDDDPVKWVPLDPNVILPFHRWLYRIPATFRPKGGLVNFSTKTYDNPHGKVVKKKKKSKGKKKR